VTAADFPGEKPSKQEGHPASPSPWLVVKRLDTIFDPERAFVDLYGESENAFWLDSSGSTSERAFRSWVMTAGPWAGR
jgi:hypothetical protein